MGKKILYGFLAVIGVSLVIFIVYQQWTIRNQNEEIKNSVIEMKQLRDDIIRSQSQYVDKKGFEQFLKDNNIALDTIQKDVNSLGGKIDAVNVVLASSKGQVVNGGSSTTVTPSPNAPAKNCSGDLCAPDPYNYWATKQTLQLNEDFGKVLVPFGSISFSAGSPDNKPWSYEIPSRQYQINNTIAHSSSGQTVVYNDLRITSGDKTYQVPLTSSKTVEKYPASSFSWWNPRLALGVSGQVLLGGDKPRGEVTPTASISVMSYGKTRVSPDLRILDLGVGYNINSKAPSAQLSPIQVNVGKILTGNQLIQNLWLGPVFSLDTKGSFGAGVGLQVGL